MKTKLRKALHGQILHILKAVLPISNCYFLFRLTKQSSCRSCWFIISNNAVPIALINSVGFNKENYFSSGEQIILLFSSEAVKDYAHSPTLNHMFKDKYLRSNVIILSQLHSSPFHMQSIFILNKTTSQTNANSCFSTFLHSLLNILLRISIHI